MPRKPQDEPEAAEGAAAKDGEPDQNELERRRQARAGGNGGTSVSDRSEGEEPEEELFPHGTIDGDPKVTHKNLIKSGARVTVTASLTKAEIPNPGGGLFDPEVETHVLVRVLPGKVEQIPLHEEKGGKQVVKEWKLRQELRAVFVQNADDMYTREQVLDLLHEAGASSAVVTRLMGDGAALAQA